MNSSLRGSARLAAVQLGRAVSKRSTRHGSRSEAASMSLNPESIDLAVLSASVRARVGSSRLDGYLDGKTRLRDAVTDELGCSTLEAEQVTDTLVARGFARFFDANDEPARPGSAPGHWQLA